ncbi:hypothetical protein D3C75_1358130 [compost metagenome]
MDFADDPAVLGSVLTCYISTQIMKEGQHVRLQAGNRLLKIELIHDRNPVAQHLPGILVNLI